MGIKPQVSPARYLFFHHITSRQPSKPSTPQQIQNSRTSQKLQHQTLCSSSLSSPLCLPRWQWVPPEQPRKQLVNSANSSKGRDALTVLAAEFAVTLVIARILAVAKLREAMIPVVACRTSLDLNDIDKGMASVGILCGLWWLYSFEA
ncbi:hypothetical protein ABVK25_010649 [Lepraria finkii]|uniref:Uncharacterized protein n=1 Tax=Lepraria finkii TaxID=1340010 RepID=A0ABR4AV89_9LECA